MLFIFIIFMVYVFLTYIMFAIICKKLKNESILNVINNSISDALKPYEVITLKGQEWVKKQEVDGNIEDVTIKSKEGLILHAILIKQENPKGAIIECHGYRSSAERDLYTSCYEYYNIGYDLLLIDQRITGKSEGKYITFGVKESEDVTRWCDFINQRYPNKPIILAGISMGATTVLLATEKLKNENNVKAVIADSGFISAWDEVIYAIGHYFHLPGKCFIHLIDMWCRLFAKFSLKEKNTVEVLKNVKLPILWFHGEDDDFVPAYNSVTNYQNYNGKKEILIIPGANHGMGYLVDTKKYLNTVKNFIKSACEGRKNLGIVDEKVRTVETQNLSGVLKNISYLKIRNSDKNHSSLFAV